MILEKENIKKFVEKLIIEFKDIDIIILSDKTFKIYDKNESIIFNFDFSLIDNIYRISINHFFENSGSGMTFSNKSLSEIRIYFIDYLKTKVPRHYMKYVNSLRKKKINRIL